MNKQDNSNITHQIQVGDSNNHYQQSNEVLTFFGVFNIIPSG